MNTVKMTPKLLKDIECLAVEYKVISENMKNIYGILLRIESRPAYELTMSINHDYDFTLDYQFVQNLKPALIALKKRYEDRLSVLTLTLGEEGTSC